MLRHAFLSGAAASLIAIRPASSAAAAPIHGVVIGDSIALGFGASRGGRGFLQLAFARATADRPGSHLLTLAAGGAMVTDVIDRQVPLALATQPDLAIVCVGGNDVLHQTRAGRMRAEFADLLRRLRADVAPQRIVVCGVPDVSVSPLFSDVRTAVRTVSQSENEAVRSATLAAGAEFVDLFAAMQHFKDAATYLGGDHFHPSDTGYAALAAIAEPVIARAIRAQR